MQLFREGFAPPLPALLCWEAAFLCSWGGGKGRGSLTDHTFTLGFPPWVVLGVIFFPRAPQGFKNRSSNVPNSVKAWGKRASNHSDGFLVSFRFGLIMINSLMLLKGEKKKEKKKKKKLSAISVAFSEWGVGLNPSQHPKSQQLHFETLVLVTSSFGSCTASVIQTMALTPDRVAPSGFCLYPSPSCCCSGNSPAE